MAQTTSDTFQLTGEQAETLLAVLRDLGYENCSILTVAQREVYAPVHLGAKGIQTYADAVERLAFTALTS